MVTRNHFETFLTLRNKASKYRSFTRYEASEEERITLVNNEENGYIESGTVDSPYWVAYVDQFRFETSKINKKIDELEEIQKNILKLKNKEIFGDDSFNDNHESEIDQKCQEISRLFNRLHSLVNQVRNISRGEGLKDRIIRNILQWEYHVISNLSARFREVQKGYLNKIREYDDYMIKFDETDPDDPLGAMSNYQDINLLDNFTSPGEDDAIVSVGRQQQQLRNTFVASDTKFLHQREQEMNNILKSMEELNSIFQDINTAVINQGSLLDRIDYNIENVEMSVHQGVIELAKAEKSVRRSRKMKCVMIIAFSILLLLIIIIVKS